MEIVIEEFVHIETDCWQMEIANFAHHIPLFQMMVTNVWATHAKIQTKWWMRMVLAAHAKITTDQTTLEEHALTHAQMQHTSILLMVHARNAHDSIDLMISEETASEINAMTDNSSTTVVYAKTAQLAQELC